MAKHGEMDSRKWEQDFQSFKEELDRIVVNQGKREVKEKEKEKE